MANGSVQGGMHPGFLGNWQLVGARGPCPFGGRGGVTSPLRSDPGSHQPTAHETARTAHKCIGRHGTFAGRLHFDQTQRPPAGRHRRPARRSHDGPRGRSPLRGPRGGLGAGAQNPQRSPLPGGEGARPRVKSAHLAGNGLCRLPPVDVPLLLLKLRSKSDQRIVLRLRLKPAGQPIGQGIQQQVGTQPGKLSAQRFCSIVGRDG
jgi:hypothetical protein